jgi:hypothetical protein
MAENRFFLKLPYILAYKSRNFGQILSYILTIRLIPGSKHYSICFPVGTNASNKFGRSFTYFIVYLLIKLYLLIF